MEPGARAEAVKGALDALCAARVAHRICHSSGNGVPLAEERKERSFKVLLLDVGLAGAQLGLRITDLAEVHALFRINEGALAEQWIGQHLLDARPRCAAPELFSTMLPSREGKVLHLPFYLVEELPRLVDH